MTKFIDGYDGTVYKNINNEYFIPVVVNYNGKKYNCIRTTTIYHKIKRKLADYYKVVLNADIPSPNGYIVTFSVDTFARPDGRFVHFHSLERYKYYAKDALVEVYEDLPDCRIAKFPDDLDILNVTKTEAFDFNNNDCDSILHYSIYGVNDYYGKTKKIAEPFKSFYPINMEFDKSNMHLIKKVLDKDVKKINTYSKQFVSSFSYYDKVFNNANSNSLYKDRIINANSLIYDILDKLYSDVPDILEVIKLRLNSSPNIVKTFLDSAVYIGMGKNTTGIPIKLVDSSDLRINNIPDMDSVYISTIGLNDMTEEEVYLNVAYNLLLDKEDNIDMFGKKIKSVKINNNSFAFDIARQIARNVYNGSFSKALYELNIQNVITKFTFKQEGDNNWKV